MFRIKFESPQKELFQGDQQLPIFSRVTTGYHVGELVNILMKNDLEQVNVCTVQPLGVTENASFLLDNDVVNFQDLKADDLGS